MNNDIAIVLIGYNRLHCIKRALKSLELSIYDDSVDLIISIDNSGCEELYKYVKLYKWKFGRKKVIIRNERLGLKRHIIECGNLTKEYENLVVLEDDIYVSPYFYNYTKQAVEFYKDNDNIAGISLYKHKLNIYANKPFQNMNTKYDTFFIQYAQSWGQIWSRKEWNHFMHWLEMQDDKFEYSDKVPENLFYWSEQSWLKYHIRYCIENNKYFVYPDVGHSTNFNNIGSHATINSPAYQVNLMYDSKEYNFMPFDDKAVKYDSFFERECIYETLGIDKEDICIDLYGMKKNKDKKRYWLTTSIEDFKIIRSFGLDLKPHEMNVIYGVGGNYIFLYDTKFNLKNKTDRKKHKYYLYLYYLGEINKETLLDYMIAKYKEWLKYIIKKISNKKHI